MDPRTTTALLYLDGVTVSFDGFRALNNLSFTIEPGEMRAVIGPNGAGKTTMMDVVTGKTRADAGDVYFDGILRPLAARRDRDRAARHRPQISEAHRVRDAHGRGQYRACAQGRPARAQDAVLARDQRGDAAASSGILEIIRLVGACVGALPGCCPTVRNSGSRSACCLRRSRSFCWWTSRLPA